MAYLDIPNGGIHDLGDIPGGASLPKIGDKVQISDGRTGVLETKLGPWSLVRIEDELQKIKTVDIQEIPKIKKITREQLREACEKVISKEYLGERLDLEPEDPFIRVAAATGQMVLLELEKELFEE